MTSNAPISDELLSAYLDNAVTAEERALVEDAIARNPDVAWRLSSLRYTVALLRQLPELHVPRPFTLQESQVAAWGEHGEAAIRESVANSAGRRREPVHTSWWTRVRIFWQAGNPVWRNAAAACATLLLVLFVGGEMLAPVTVSPTNMLPLTTADIAGDVPMQQSEPAVAAVEAPAGDGAAAGTQQVSEATGERAAPDQAERSAKAAPAEEVPAEAMAAGASTDAAAPLAQAAVEEAPVQESVTAAGEPVTAAGAAPQPGESQAALAAALPAAVAVDEAQVVTSVAAPAARVAAADALGSPGSEDAVGDLFAGAPPPPGVAAPMAAVPAAAMPSQPLSETVSDEIVSSETVSSDATLAQTDVMTATSMLAAGPTATPASVAALVPTTTVPPTSRAPAQIRAPEPSAAGGTADQPATTTPSAPLDWWRMSRLGLAGLTVLFAALWLASRRTHPAA
ncbi:MAG: hypothetical protein H6644_01275 [Caldilineaceae bacterium]|nr:hypothetical protein [Caldilineaceae bacterium]